MKWLLVFVTRLLLACVAACGMVFATEWLVLVFDAVDAFMNVGEGQ